MSIDILLKFVPNGPIGNKFALVEVMAWRLFGVTPECQTNIFQQF